MIIAAPVREPQATEFISKAVIIIVVVASMIL